MVIIKAKKVLSQSEDMYGDFHYIHKNTNLQSLQNL